MIKSLIIFKCFTSFYSRMWVVTRWTFFITKLSLGYGCKWYLKSKSLATETGTFIYEVLFHNPLKIWEHLLTDWSPMRERESLGAADCDLCYPTDNDLFFHFPNNALKICVGQIENTLNISPVPDYWIKRNVC